MRSQRYIFQTLVSEKETQVIAQQGNSRRQSVGWTGICNYANSSCKAPISGAEKGTTNKLSPEKKRTAIFQEEAWALRRRNVCADRTEQTPSATLRAGRIYFSEGFSGSQPNFPDKCAVRVSSSGLGHTKELEDEV